MKYIFGILILVALTLLSYQVYNQSFEIKDLRQAINSTNNLINQTNKAVGGVSQQLYTTNSTPTVSAQPTIQNCMGDIGANQHISLSCH